MAAPASFCRAWLLQNKKGEVTVGHFTFFVCGKPCFYGAPVHPMEQTVPPIPRVVLMPTPP